MSSPKSPTTSPVSWRWRDPLDEAGIVMDNKSTASSGPPSKSRTLQARSISATTHTATLKSNMPHSNSEQSGFHVEGWMSERNELLRCLERSQAREREAATTQFQLQERLRIALDRNAELEMKVRVQAEHLRKAENLLRSSAQLVSSGPFTGLPFPPSMSPNAVISATPNSVHSVPTSNSQTQLRSPLKSMSSSSSHPNATETKTEILVAPEVEEIIKGIASIEATNMANLNTISQQLSNSQSINHELIAQVAQLHNRHEQAEVAAKKAEAEQQAQLEEQQQREREEFGRQQQSATSAIIGELRRLRAAVTEKDEIEKVLVGGFSTLVAAASPGMPSRHDPRYYTAPLGSPSVYATPAAPNFTRRQRHGAHTKESIVESSLRNLHNTAMDELEASSSRQTSSVRSSPVHEFNPGAKDLQREMAWDKFASALRQPSTWEEAS